MTVTSSRLRRVDWLTRVAGRLDPAVWQGDRERARDDTVGILGLRLLEVGLAVVVGNPVLIGIRLGGQLFLWGAIGRGASRDC